MRGHYELTLSDGTKIPMRFCTWSLKRFCQVQGISPAEIGDALSGESTLDAIVNLLRSAAEYPLYKEGITPNFTDLEVCDWIDDIGGIASTKLQDIFKVLSDSMVSGVDNTPSKKGKSSDVKKN
jgi:hypothetical protein